MSDKPRRARVSQTIKSHLAEMIQRDVADPRVRAAGLLTVNQVELNSDMSVAMIYVSFFGIEDRIAAAAIEGLEAAGRHLRGPLGRRMNLARAPELRFALDESPEFRARLSNIIRDDEERHVEDEDAEEGDE